MSKDTKSEAPAKAESKKQESLTEIETKQGFRGVEVDPTPNKNYTVAGVTAGLPTPETDAGAAKEARKVTGLGLSGLEAAAAEKAGKKG